MTSVFNWLIAPLRAWTERRDQQRVNRDAIQLARTQADYAELRGDTASADFWRDVEIGINQRSK